MKTTRQVMSFRGSVADDIAKKILLSAHGADLGSSLFKFIRTNSDDLVCDMEKDIIVIGKRTDRHIKVQ
jgi:hypothetical protein